MPGREQRSTSRLSTSGDLDPTVNIIVSHRPCIERSEFLLRFRFYIWFTYESTHSEVICGGFLAALSPPDRSHRYLCVNHTHRAELHKHDWAYISPAICSLPWIQCFTKVHCRCTRESSYNVYLSVRHTRHVSMTLLFIVATFCSDRHSENKV